MSKEERIKDLEKRNAKLTSRLAEAIDNLNRIESENDELCSKLDILENYIGRILASFERRGARVREWRFHILQKFNTLATYMHLIDAHVAERKEIQATIHVDQMVFMDIANVLEDLAEDKEIPLFIDVEDHMDYEGIL